MNQTNNEINRDKFKNINNEELIKEFHQRAKEGRLSKDDLVLAMVKVN